MLLGFEILEGSDDFLQRKTAVCPISRCVICAGSGLTKGRGQCEGYKNAVHIS